MSVDALARAVLYEGYRLYPYRSSSLKNRRPLLFGTLYPEAWAATQGENDPTDAFVECLLVLDAGQSVDDPPEAAVAPRSGIDVDAALAVTLRFLRLDGSVELREEIVEGALGSTCFEREAARGRLDVTAMALGNGLHRVRVHVACDSDVRAGAHRDEVEHAALGAAHVVLRVRAGAGASRLLSLLDPPREIVREAEACARKGLFPVLVGDALLASPIALEDRAALAPESQGDLFDATEIEEILCLRVKTMTDVEKREVRATGGAAARLLDRVDALGAEDMLRLHGARRTRAFEPGDEVCIRPRGRRADALDVVLDGLAATVVAIEITAEGERLVCVTVDDDPGKDLGDQGFPGHRFFFREDELARRP